MCMGRTVDQSGGTRKGEGTQVDWKGEVEHDLAWVPLDCSPDLRQCCELRRIRRHRTATLEYRHCIHGKLPRLILRVLA
jgi:hypothetical protein